MGRRGAEPVLAADGSGDGAGGGADDGRHVPALVRRREAGLAEVFRRRRAAEPVRPPGKRRHEIKAELVLRRDLYLELSSRIVGIGSMVVCAVAAREQCRNAAVRACGVG